MPENSYQQLGNTAQARVLRTLLEVGTAGIDGPDIRRRIDHGDYRKRICELIYDFGIDIDRSRQGNPWKHYTLIDSPETAIAKYKGKWRGSRSESKPYVGIAPAGPVESGQRGIKSVPRGSASEAGRLLRDCRREKEVRLKSQTTLLGGS